MTAAPRCSAWAREVGLRPQGTAPSADRWLLVDWPLPWPRDESDVEVLAPVREALAADGVRSRVQLVVPRPDATARRVVVHERSAADGGWFAGYRRRSVEVDPDELLDAARALLADPTTGDDEPAVDVLICSHGARDRCCGSAGTALAVEATARGASVWRTSHLGGHRFAPTAVVLPEGTCWAFLDGESLAAVLTRVGDAAHLAGRYRGCTALASPEAQAADAAALAAAGWPWLDGRRRAGARAVEPERDGTVRVTLEHAVGDRFEVDVREARRMPVPDCGQPLEAAKKAEPELEVVGIRAR